MKIIPGALAQLAKDFKVETQKGHFPHYFNPIELYGELDWSGQLPEYKYFEPKRTSQADYNEMVEEFKDRQFQFLEVSRKYIKGDVIALHQILISFFTEFKSKFPINPLQNISAPGLAFRTWRTQQLPLLHKDCLKVYDLSRSLDPKFRGAYLGGIVDVYKPHLNIGKGYYYDVNSLYPTAMLRPMPVDLPTPINITKDEFLEETFFGYLQATVRAPANEYIGLLPIRLNGRLVCPAGIFSGFFFSEELRFALANGYELLKVGEAFSFQKGNNTFLELILSLNDIKVQAQLEKRPVLRNIAKLLMNSMYGRFGMHIMT